MTRSYCDHGLGQIVDFMPVLDDSDGSHQIIRQVSCVRGEVLYDLRCQPAFDYARARHKVHLVDGGAIFEDENGHSYGLESSIGLEVAGPTTSASFRLKEGEYSHFVFKRLDAGQDLASMTDTERLFANGAGTTSGLVFVNLSTQPTQPTLYFYDQEGQLMEPESVVDLTEDLEVTEDGALSTWTEMEPLGELTILTHGRGEGVSGSVRVVSDGPIGGFLRFDLPGIGVAGVGASQPVRDALFPARRQADGISTAWQGCRGWLPRARTGRRGPRGLPCPGGYRWQQPRTGRPTGASRRSLPRRGWR